MINNVIIFGRLTADPQPKTTSNGISYCLFSIANEVGYGDNKRTNFFRCNAWRGTADVICKYLHKGSQIGIAGQLMQNTYEDKEGNKRDSVDIMVETLQFCDGGNSAQNGSNNADGSVVVNDTAEVVGTPKKASTSQEKASGFFLNNDDEFAPF